ncbi:hypothetical protein Gpo141_00009144 [Globisporangium polare]
MYRNLGIDSTADVRAITYVEMCVLSRSDFQRVVTSHSEDRKRVVASMLSTCMVNNEVEDVYCPLKELVRSVYSRRDGRDGTRDGDGKTRVSEIDALKASELILDVINPDLEDKSILFGINTRLEIQLTAKRDAERVKAKSSGKREPTRASKAVQVSPSPPVVMTPPSSALPLAPHCDDHCPSQSRIKHLEQSLEMLIEMVSKLAAPTRCDYGVVSRDEDGISATRNSDFADRLRDKRR